MKRLLLITILVGSLLPQMAFSKSLSAYEQGLDLYKQGKYEISLVFFERAFQENPLNDKLYFYLGNIYNHKGMFDKAITAYKRGLDLTSKDNQVLFLFNLARSYQSAKQYKSALKTYEQVEKLTNNFPNIYLYKGMIYFHLRDKTEVIKAWETYLIKAPGNPQDASVRKAIEYLKDKNFKWPENPEDNAKIIYVGNLSKSGKGGDTDGKVKTSKSERDEQTNMAEDKDKKADGKPSKDDIKKTEDELVKDLKKKEEEEAKNGVDDSVKNVKVNSEDLKVKNQKKKEGKEYDEIER